MDELPFISQNWCPHSDEIKTRVKAPAPVTLVRGLGGNEAPSKNGLF